MSKIAVIGAGVVGLSTALNIQKILPDAKVKIIADKFFEETTSHGAGGLFLPTMKTVPGVPRENLIKWCQGSWDFYSSLALSPKASETGHMVSPGYVPCNSRNEEDRTRIYKDIVFNYREMTQDEIKKLNINGYKFKENGGEMERRRICNLEELVDQYDVVVNCTGYGSRELLNDDQLCPVRGQLARVKAPWIKVWIYPDHDSYILPNMILVALGGTKQVGDENLEVDPSDSRSILDRCLQLFPALEGYELDHEWVGLRPTRTPLRLESEIFTFPNGSLRVVHNYGHGSSGIALSWGTSIEAANLVKEMLNNFQDKETV